MSDPEELLRSIRESSIGNHHEMEGPLGPRLVGYSADSSPAQPLERLRVGFLPWQPTATAMVLATRFRAGESKSRFPVGRALREAELS